jgi:ABC-type bacteriocin/lantibiotic exporter with double-glycine peptidase domain
VPQNLPPVLHVPQQHDADCLAACAAMLLTYNGVSIRYERLLRLLNIQVFGAPGRNLYRLSQVGVEVVYREGAMGTLEEIITRRQPCIALVKTEFLHYWTYPTDHAVVVGVNDDSIFLNDPAFVEHPMRVTKAEFELAWMEFNYRYCMIMTGSTHRA